MSNSSDFKSTLKSLADNLANGNKSASDVAGSLNLWLKEGSEALRVKIEDEVERSVSKMGFIKRGEFEALKQQVAELTSVGLVRTEKGKEQGKPKKLPKKVKSEADKKHKKPVEKTKRRSEKKSTIQKNSKIAKAKKVK
jgi:hypothetical protein